MDNNIIKIDEENLKNDLKGVIRKTIEETLNTMLDEEAAELCNAERHERTDERRNYRSGHYHRKLLTSAGEVDLSVPKLRLAPFEAAIIERYRRRESSVKYREILRLKHLGFSERNIARTAGVSRNTVKLVVEAAAATKIDWTYAENMDYATIENTLFPDRKGAKMGG